MIQLLKGCKYGLLVLLFLLTAKAVNAETEDFFMEAGVCGGGAFYLGDANSVPFSRMGGVGGAFLKYKLDRRWSFGVQVNAGRVGIPNFESEGSWKRLFVDAEALAEFNFFDFGYDRLKSQTRRATPYVFVGTGCCFYQDGVAFELPFGVGGKFKLSKRCNMYVTWSMCKLFKDNFDKVDNPRGLNKSKFINNDWYSKLTVGLSFDFWKYCMECRSGLK